MFLLLVLQVSRDFTIPPHFEPIFQDLAMQAACNPVDNGVLHPMKAQLVALRIVAYCISIEDEQPPSGRANDL